MNIPNETDHYRDLYMDACRRVDTLTAQRAALLTACKAALPELRTMYELRATYEQLNNVSIDSKASSGRVWQTAKQICAAIALAEETE